MSKIFWIVLLYGACIVSAADDLEKVGQNTEGASLLSLPLLPFEDSAEPKKEVNDQFVKKCRRSKRKKLIHQSAPRNMVLKSIACPDCNKLFLYVGALKSHRNAEHTKEFSYICMYCSTTFYHPKALGQHKRIVHAIAPNRLQKPTALPFQEVFPVEESLLAQSSASQVVLPMEESFLDEVSLIDMQDFLLQEQLKKEKNDLSAPYPLDRTKYTFDEIVLIMGCDPREFR